MASLIASGPHPPPPYDPLRAAYKDWLHVNFFDRESGCVGLINASLHGDPADARALAVGAALIHVPDIGWIGNIESSPASTARIAAASLALPNVAIAVDAALNRVSASARIGALEIDIETTAQSSGYELQQPVPFGSGWISWSVVPRLSVRGSVRFDRQTIRLDNASAYHDHNWGRWHWGDDARWEWGAFHADGGSTFVFARPTDLARNALAPPTVMVDARGRRDVFSGTGVDVAYEGTLSNRLRRLPGALAAMHQDRARPRLPARVHLRCADGTDRVAINFTATAAAQLIAGDPVVPGYRFIHELAGTFEATGSIGGASVECRGLGVFEYLL
jgi:hypothetical protein